MLHGQSINEVAKRVLELAAQRRDYVVQAQSIRMIQGAEARDYRLEWQNSGAYLGKEGLTLQDIARDQLAGHLQIPRPFWDRVAGTAPDLLPVVVNRLLRATPETERRLVRTYPGVARAFLSDRYRRLDNDDVAAHILPILEAGSFEVVSARVTDARLYLHALSPRLRGEIKVGDPVQFGITISNSEVGISRLSLEAFLLRLKCSNGMILPESIARRHVGGKSAWDDLVGEGGEIREDTERAQDKALWLTMRDGIAALTTPERFKALVERTASDGARPVNMPAAEAVVELKRHGLRESEAAGVLEAYVREGDRTLWGLANAVTAQANASALDYDRGVELEKIGGKVVSMPASEYRRLAA